MFFPTFLFFLQLETIYGSLVTSNMAAMGVEEKKEEKRGNRRREKELSKCGGGEEWIRGSLSFWVKNTLLKKETGRGERVALGLRDGKVSVMLINSEIHLAKKPFVFYGGNASSHFVD